MTNINTLKSNSLKVIALKTLIAEGLSDWSGSVGKAVELAKKVAKECEKKSPCQEDLNRWSGEFLEHTEGIAIFVKQAQVIAALIGRVQDDSQIVEETIEDVTDEQVSEVLPEDTLDDIL